MMRSERVLDQLQRQGKTPVIPPKRNRATLRAYDKDLYKARHLRGKLLRQTQAVSSDCDAL
jgi:hypothetical protein